MKKILFVYFILFGCYGIFAQAIVPEALHGTWTCNGYSYWTFSKNSVSIDYYDNRVNSRVTGIGNVTGVKPITNIVTDHYINIIYPRGYELAITITKGAGYSYSEGQQIIEYLIFSIDNKKIWRPGQYPTRQISNLPPNDVWEKTSAPYVSPGR